MKPELTNIEFRRLLTIAFDEITKLRMEIEKLQAYVESNK